MFLYFISIFLIVHLDKCYIITILYFVLLQLDKCITQYYRRFSCVRSLVSLTPDDECARGHHRLPYMWEHGSRHSWQNVIGTSKQRLQGAESV